MSDEPQQVGQDEIERLLEQARSSAGKSPATTAPGGQGKPSTVDVFQAVASAGGEASKPAFDAPERALAQGDLEAVLRKSDPGVAAGAPRTKLAADPPAARDPGLASGDVEYLLTQAEQALASIQSPTDSDIAGLPSFRLEDLAGAPPTTEMATFDLIRDVELDLKIEFGRTQMYLEDVLRLRRGSVVPLDKLAGDPVDIFVNGRLIARGEVLVLNDNFCVRVAELIAGESVASG